MLYYIWFETRIFMKYYIIKNVTWIISKNMSSIDDVVKKYKDTISQVNFYCKIWNYIETLSIFIKNFKETAIRKRRDGTTCGNTWFSDVSHFKVDLKHILVSIFADKHHLGQFSLKPNLIFYNTEFWMFQMKFI